MNPQINFQSKNQSAASQKGAWPASLANSFFWQVNDVTDEFFFLLGSEKMGECSKQYVMFEVLSPSGNFN